eukprot:gene15686-18599_t
MAHLIHADYTEFELAAKLYAAAKDDDRLSISRLSTKMSVNIVDELGRSPVFSAAYYGNADAIQSLAAKGANVKLQDLEGCTALHYACQQGNFDAVKRLCEAGAKPNVPDNDGSTPVFAAAESKHLNCIEILISYGANLDPIAGMEDRAPLLVVVYDGDNSSL